MLYRAVDTPFPYTDDNALVPHMPMNGAGFDCNAKQIMSDWMVSIPAVRKQPELVEYFPSANACFNAGSTADNSAQPYVEVSPGTAGYDQALAAAQQRLAILHTGENPVIQGSSTSAQPTFSMYSYCPDTSDIFDPDVLRDPQCHPVPTTKSPSPLVAAAHVPRARSRSLDSG